MPAEALQAGDLPVLRQAITAQFGGRPGATQDYNALRALLERASQHLWITIEDGFLWWATVRDGVEVSPGGETAERGRFWLTLDRPWSNHGLDGRRLAFSDLPGGMQAVAGFRGTLCEPQASREALRIINGEEDVDAAAAKAARNGYAASVARLIARLGPKDIEVLVDLILSRCGWARIARLGGTTEGIDVEVENPAIGEIAFVQVKSVADNAVLTDYVRRFGECRDRYDRMIFAVHSPRGTLTPPPDLPVQVWTEARIADLVVRFGLGDWVAKRV